MLDEDFIKKLVEKEVKAQVGRTLKGIVDEAVSEVDFAQEVEDAIDISDIADKVKEELDVDDLEDRLSKCEESLETIREC